ncbi:MAG: hypothetical protein PVF54_10125, partial [Anaerolineae bacterium]
MKVSMRSEGVTSRKARGPLQHSGLARLLDSEGTLRVLILGLLILAVFGIFARRLWRFQFLQGQDYREEAEEQSTKLITIPASRGIIYDRGGERLVRNVPSFYVTVVPDYLPEDAEAAEDVLIRLAVLLDMPYVAQEGEEDGLREIVLRQLDGWLVDFSYEEAPASALRQGLDEIRTVAPYRPIVVERNVGRGQAILVAQEASNLPGVAV